uniref:Nuclear export mediator factor NEMF n=1 Tax=Timema shepardi TaxID=629360 RepID=A0A7R9ANW4_TIMSH|nr:unnamed protein product [Timema shepardi]
MAGEHGACVGSMENLVLIQNLVEPAGTALPSSPLVSGRDVTGKIRNLVRCSFRQLANMLVVLNLTAEDGRLRFKSRLIGMRVAQVYDIDHKTYLIKLQRTEEKAILLLESGNRIHTTAFEWPKNVAPSGFSMKMRKHLKNKRLESMRQLGMDRIVDLQFGSGEVAYHIILELYDRGNIILTDCDLTIINILRPHTEGELVRFAVREKYPVGRAHEQSGAPSEEKLKDILSSAKVGEGLKKILNPHLEYGPAIIDHVLLQAGFPSNCKLGKGFSLSEDLPKLCAALDEAEQLMIQAAQQASKGYIIQKREKRPLQDGTEEDLFSNQEFHPMVFLQHCNQPYKEFDSFDMAVDEFFSNLEGQKIDMKTLQQEREAMKKLANVRKDHDLRLVALERTQESDKQKAELITRNQQLVDNAVLAVRSALANQMAWSDIQNLVKEAQERGDPVASCIKGLKLEVNHVTLMLTDPYAEDDSSDEDTNVQGLKPTLIDIDLDLTAFANARKYYDQKRNAAKKQQKTLESQGKALKSAERKTKQTLKDVQTMSNINKARKLANALFVLSSTAEDREIEIRISVEGTEVIGGRDQIQNELIVKRYMKAGDIYVHADISGASSVVIRNPSGEPVPPKTLNEAGIMAISYSVAWEAKVVTSAWWVQSDQVSKTAPTGEYLTTGSFMVRGKKNYLPPCHLIMGFSFLFKLEDGSISRHKDERKVRGTEDDISVTASSVDTLSLSEQDQEIELDDTDDEKQNEDSKGETQVVEQGVGEEQGKKGDEDEEDSDGGGSVGSEDSKHVYFPDTEIKIELDRTNQITLQPKSTSILKSTLQDLKKEKVVFLGDDKPVIFKSENWQQKRLNKKKGHGESGAQKEQEDIPNDKTKEEKASLMKRGQKSKLKKIKEKYKDQDEVERKLIMDILQVTNNIYSSSSMTSLVPTDSSQLTSDSQHLAGSGKDSKKTKKGKEVGNKGTTSKLNKKVPVTRPKPQPQPGEGGEDSDGGEGVEEVTVNTDIDMLDSLTGLPLTEDELLFAVPVVAPYNVLLNYKFKVKLTPGTGKRGKAARTALNMFLKDRNTSSREKDLIRSVKDENLARNLPGKVKLSAPQMQKLRK